MRAETSVLAATDYRIQLDYQKMGQKRPVPICPCPYSYLLQCLQRVFILDELFHE